LTEQATTTFVTYSYARRGKKVRFATGFARGLFRRRRLVDRLGIDAKPAPIWAEIVDQEEIAG
jgi:hypothetical protein